ncbi:hypothetical protein OG693_39210 (plasmid) [Streptomyces sp. NBC_01259]|uniref:hypothetical protein n=1 Tax=Streptomyces sp. NBC_01259 TaxID=2903800 RepID=UPI002F90B459
MSARDDLIGYALVALPNEPAFAKCEEKADAYRLEVIAERDAQIIAWLEKKAREEGRNNKDSRTRGDVLFRMADKLSRGAVRPPLSKGPGPSPEEAVRKALEPVERLALAFENTGDPEIGRQIRAAITAGAATP